MFFTVFWMLKHNQLYRIYLQYLKEVSQKQMIEKIFFFVSFDSILKVATVCNFFVIFDI